MEQPEMNGPVESATVTAVNAVPTGTVFCFAGENIPAGYLLCDGKPVSRKDYPNLFDVIGGTLPDLRSRFVLGAGKGNNLTEQKLNASGGEEKHQLSVQEMPSHDHYDRRLGTLSGKDHGYPAQTGTLGQTDEFVTSRVGGNEAHNNMPPFYVLYYIIKY